MEQQIFLEGLRLNFKLRGSDRRKLQSIVGEFRLLGKVNQITTKLKILPKQWDSNRMRAIISPRYSQLTNRNNRIANERLADIEKEFNANIEYLCNNIIELEDIASYLKQIINNRYSMKKKEPKPQSIITLLRSTIEKAEVEQSTKDKNLYRVNRFKTFLESNKIKDDVTSISYDTILLFKQDLEKNGNSTYVKQMIGMLKTYLGRIDNFNYDSRIDKIKIKEISLHNYVALTVDEISKIYNLTDDELKTIVEGEKEETRDKKLQLIKQYRDLFILQCLVGVRVSDILKLVDSKYIKTDDEGYKYYDFYAKKHNGDCTINFILWDNEPKANKLKGLIEKINSNYIDTIKKLDNQKYNQYIKKFIKLSNIDRLEDYTEEQNGKEIKTQKYISDYITSHDSRHTFVTNCIRVLDIPKDTIIEMTGHKDVEMINRIYANLTKKDLQQKQKETILKRRKEISNNHPNQYEKLPQTNKEYYEVLRMLGAKESEFIGYSDVYQLLPIYCRYESKILDKVYRKIDINKLKDIFNEHASTEDRIKALNELVDILLKGI